MAKFVKNYTYRTPLVTIDFNVGDQTVDPDVIASAKKAGALIDEKDQVDGGNEPSKGGKTSRPLDLKE